MSVIIIHFKKKEVLMKKRSFLLMITFFTAFFAILLNGCKDEQNEPIKTQDVVFGINQLIPAAKSEVICSDAQPVKAEVVIDGVSYYPNVFTIEGKRYTEAIKLMLEDENHVFNVSRFVLRDKDDNIVLATPEKNSHFAGYVTKSVGFDFTLSAFKKAQVDVEVLCFQPNEYENFGFAWFALSEIAVREIHFFGDFCTGYYADYAGSLYENQSNGLKPDMPAIFKVVVKKDNVEVPYSPFSNEAFLGEGQPLAVHYPDNLNNSGELFTFELYIYVKQGNTFAYKLFKTFKAVDGGALQHLNGSLVGDVGNDGIYDFVLGSCNLSTTDIQLPPYQNLPEITNLTLSHPGSLSYWAIRVNSFVPATGGYDFETGNYAGWCGDKNTTIVPGTYNMYTYSSLVPELWPPVTSELQPADMEKVNYLFNHLDDFGIDILDNASLAANKDAIQDAIWDIIHGSNLNPALSGPAKANGSGYSPMPGEFAAILFFPDKTVYRFQLIFMMIDP